MFQHGYRRFTEDVHILVTPEGLQRIHEHCDGLGCLPPFPGSKHLRDTELGVKIEFLISGQYPGDGKPKPVEFPNPAQATLDIDGIKYLQLPALIELKLASGMTNPSRLRDLADVLELMKLLKLPHDLARQLHPYLRDPFAEMWAAAQSDEASE